MTASSRAAPTSAPPGTLPAAPSADEVAAPTSRAAPPSAAKAVAVRLGAASASAMVLPAARVLRHAVCEHAREEEEGQQQVERAQRWTAEDCAGGDRQRPAP